MPKLSDLAGQRFGYLTACRRVQYLGRFYWLCSCQCGQQTKVNIGHLKSGRIISCGCYRRTALSARNTKHADSQSREYKIWKAMWKRCRQHPRYLKRGITVSQQWQRYETFIADMGRAPSTAHSIDRCNGNKGYSKSNCRWATSKEQARNTSRNKMVTFRERTECLAHWAELLNIPYCRLFDRLSKQGLTPEEAFTRPSRYKERV